MKSVLGSRFLGNRLKPFYKMETLLGILVVILTALSPGDANSDDNRQAEDPRQEQHGDYDNDPGEPDSESDEVEYIME